MEPLASSNRGGLLKCLKAKVNVDRRWGMPVAPVALVAASISALLATGCVSLDAPPSPASLVELEPPSTSEDHSLHVASIGDTFSAFISAASVRGSDPRATLLEPSGPLGGPLIANEALSASDNGAWLFALNFSLVSDPISVAIDTDPFGIVPEFRVSPTDFLLDLNLAAAALVEGVAELADSQVAPFDVRPAIAAPTETLVSPVVSSMTMTPRRDVWQGVMKATAVGFLAVVMLVPLGCSFAAGVVCSQPRAGPRRRASRRISGRFLGGLSRAIASVPAH